MSIITLEELYKSDDKFYRLTNETECHRGFQYTTGLNVDVLPFYPTGECMVGGLYFFSSRQLEHFYAYCKDMKYIREVTFEGITAPQIYSEEGKYKCPSFVLSPRKPFYVDDPSLKLDVLSMVSNYTHALRYVKEQTPELCMAAVSNDGYALRYVEKQTDEICIVAIFNNNRYALQYVNEQTHKLCLVAVSENGSALEYVKEQTPEICKAAVSNNAYALEYVKTQTHEICMAAVSNDGWVLRLVKEQTPEICMTAVSKDGESLRLVKEQTPELCLAAVSNDGLSLEYVKEQTPEICIAAVSNDGNAIYYVEDRLVKLCDVHWKSIHESIRSLEDDSDWEQEHGDLCRYPWHYSIAKHIYISEAAKPIVCEDPLPVTNEFEICFIFGLIICVFFGLLKFVILDSSWVPCRIENYSQCFDVDSLMLNPYN
jgi:phosphosulfolactate phosphohydrolase-like enzyme